VARLLRHSSHLGLPVRQRSVDYSIFRTEVLGDLGWGDGISAAVRGDPGPDNFDWK